LQLPSPKQSTAERAKYEKRVGTFRNERESPEPRLEIPPEQMDQRRAVRDALKEIPVSDGEH
jgi:hypothetical protein